MDGHGISWARQWVGQSESRVVENTPSFQFYAVLAHLHRERWPSAMASPPRETSGGALNR